MIEHIPLSILRIASTCLPPLSRERGGRPLSVPPSPLAFLLGKRHFFSSLLIPRDFPNGWTRRFWNSRSPGAERISFPTCLLIDGHVPFSFFLFRSRGCFLAGDCLFRVRSPRRRQRSRSLLLGLAVLPLPGNPPAMSTLRCGLPFSLWVTRGSREGFWHVISQPHGCLQDAARAPFFPRPPLKNFLSEENRTSPRRGSMPQRPISLPLTLSQWRRCGHCLPDGQFIVTQDPFPSPPSHAVSFSAVLRILVLC